MTTPSKKAPAIIEFLDKYTNRTRAITEDVCIDPPFGCGRSATSFRDKLSQKEFSISGLCQPCQDIIFENEEG